MKPPPLSQVVRSGFRAWMSALVVASSVSLAQESLPIERIALAPTGVGRPTDLMGSAVALLGDTAAVGAPGTQVTNGVNAGTVDIYRLQNSAWVPEAMLSPPVPAANQYFGNAVALGPDLLVVGDHDSLYTFERDGSTWQQVDQFAQYSSTQIGLSGDTLVSAGTVFVRSGSGWQIQTVLAADNDEGFVGMAIDGDLLVAASSGFSLNAPPQAVYFYSRSGTTWTREGRVQLSESYTPVYLAISGHTALVGATNDNSGISSVHAFDRDDSGNWIDYGPLDTGVNLTRDVPVSIQGDLALVGSHADYTAYTFVRSNGTWTRDLHFNDPYSRCFAAVALWGSTVLAGCPNSYTASSGFGTADFFSIDQNPPPVIAQFGQGDARAGEDFGFRVAAEGNTLLASSSLGIYFFDRTATGWTQTNTFPAPPTNFDPASVALDGDTAAIGYPAQIYPGGTSEVDVYTRSGGTWSLQATIPGTVSDDSPYFANALALQGDVLVVGELDLSSSTCHVYLRSGAVWQAAPDLNPAGGSPGDQFCYSLAISDNTLLVGAPKTDIGAQSDAGAVYVFALSGTTWTQQARILAPLVSLAAHFGTSVAIQGNTAVVGSNSDWLYASTRGEVDVYRISGNTWNWQATLAPPVEGNAPGDFGFAVAISAAEDRIVATAPYDLTHDPYAGVAFAFAFDGMQWSPTATIHASPPFPPVTNDGFGWNAALLGDKFVIGAPFDGVGGAVYVGPTSEAIFANGFEP